MQCAAEIHIASDSPMGTFWEHQTHQYWGYYLNTSGLVGIIVYLEKMIYIST